MFLGVDRFGNVVEEKNERIDSINTQYCASEEIWEPITND